MHKDTRQIANQIAHKIELYKAPNGTYPPTADETGIKQNQLRKERIYYTMSAGEPFLMYPLTYMPFETYKYDFKSKEWRHMPS